MGKLGLDWQVTENLFLDFFCEYTYKKMRFYENIDEPNTKKTLDFSNLLFGAGIGFRF